MSDRSAADVDVDARFVLANERTLLAWVRTSLAFVAGGLAVYQLGEDIAGRSTLAVVLLLVGIATALAGAVRFAAADSAVRSGRVPATGRTPYALVAVVTIIAAIGVVVVLA